MHTDRCTWTVWVISSGAQFKLSCHFIDSAEKKQPISSTKCTQFIYVLLGTIPNFNLAIHRFMWENLMKPWFMSLFILVNKNANSNWPLLWFECYLLSAISYLQLLNVWKTVCVYDIAWSVHIEICSFDSNGNMSLVCVYHHHHLDWTYANKKKSNKSLMNRDNKLH